MWVTATGAQPSPTPRGWRPCWGSAVANRGLKGKFWNRKCQILHYDAFSALPHVIVWTQRIIYRLVHIGVTSEYDWMFCATWAIVSSLLWPLLFFKTCYILQKILVKQSTLDRGYTDRIKPWPWPSITSDHAYRPIRMQKFTRSPAVAEGPRDALSVEIW